MHYAFFTSKPDVPDAPIIVKVTVTEVARGIRRAGTASVDEVLKGEMEDTTIWVSFVGECALPLQVGDAGYLAGYVPPREHPWPRTFHEMPGLSKAKPRTKNPANADGLLESVWCWLGWRCG